MLRFSHIIQHFVRYMLRRYTKLSADMIFCQFIQKCRRSICIYIVKTNTGAYKDLFYTGYISQLPKKLQIILVVCIQIFAGLWKQTLPIGTHPFCLLLFAGRMTKICRRSSHVMNISFKILFRHIRFCLFYNRGMASGLYNSALMKG